MTAYFLQFVKADGFFSTATTVGAVIADMQEFSYLVNKGDMGGQFAFQVLKEHLLWL